MALPTRRTMLKTTKQTRSMTAAATIHSFIVCWFLSLWLRSSSSVRSLVSSRLVIKAIWRSTELMLCPAAAAAAVVGDAVRSRCLQSFGTVRSRDSSLMTLTSSVSLLSLVAVDVFRHIRDASCLHTTRFICQQHGTTVLTNRCRENARRDLV